MDNEARRRYILKLNRRRAARQAIEAANDRLRMMKTHLNMPGRSPKPMKRLMVTSTHQRCNRPIALLSSSTRNTLPRKSFPMHAI